MASDSSRNTLRPLHWGPVSATMLSGFGLGPRWACKGVQARRKAHRKGHPASLCNAACAPLQAQPEGPGRFALPSVVVGSLCGPVTASPTPWLATRPSPARTQSNARQPTVTRSFPEGLNFRTMFQRTLRSVLNVFLTGLLAALPLAATVAILVWGVRLLYDWLGPGSFVGRLFVVIGLDIDGSELAGYLIGLGIVALAIFALGLLIQTRLKPVLAAAVRRVVQSIPVVRQIHDLAQKFVGLLSLRDAAGGRSMSPVWLQFGGPGKVAVLGLLSSSEVVLVGGEPYLGVLVPTAPVPVGGALIFVPQSWVSPAELGIEALTSIYVSMGVTAPEHLGKTARPAARSMPPAKRG